MNEAYTNVFEAIADTRGEAANLLMRAELMRHITEIVKENNWTQNQAAARCGLTQPRMSDLLNGKLSKFSLDALVNINAQLGQQAELVFKPA